MTLLLSYLYLLTISLKEKCKGIALVVKAVEHMPLVNSPLISPFAHSVLAILPSMLVKH